MQLGTFVKQIAIAAFAMSAIVSASSVKAQTSTDGPFTTSTPISATTTDFTGTLTFAKFDTTLGHLLSVKIQFTNSISSQLVVTNMASTYSSGNAYTIVYVGLSDPAGYLPSPFGMYGPVAGAAVDDAITPSFAYGLTPGNSATSSTLTNSQTSSFNFDVVNYRSLMLELSQSGSHTISLNVATLTSSVLINTGGNSEATQTTQAAITGQVTYTYVP